MAKKKMVKVDNVAFDPSAFEGVSKEDFIKSQKANGNLKKQFVGYDDADERETKLLSQAWDEMQPKEVKQAPAKGAK